MSGTVELYRERENNTFFEKMWLPYKPSCTYIICSAATVQLQHQEEMFGKSAETLMSHLLKDSEGDEH